MGPKRYPAQRCPHLCPVLIVPSVMEDGSPERRCAPLRAVWRLSLINFDHSNHQSESWQASPPRVPSLVEGPEEGTPLDEVDKERVPRADERSIKTMMNRDRPNILVLGGGF